MAEYYGTAVIPARVRNVMVTIGFVGNADEEIIIICLPFQVVKRQSTNLVFPAPDAP